MTILAVVFYIGGPLSIAVSEGLGAGVVLGLFLTLALLLLHNSFKLFNSVINGGRKENYNYMRHKNSNTCTVGGGGGGAAAQLRSIFRSVCLFLPAYSFIFFLCTSAWLSYVLQSLAATSYLPSPRRIATGLDYGRLMIALAVIERRAGTSAGGRDVYVNISGDFSVEDRGIDLGVGLSLYGAIRNVAMCDGVMPIAEVGLAGDLRPVFNLHRRIELGARMGFRDFIVSDKVRDDLSDLPGLAIHRMRYVSEAIACELCAGHRRWRRVTVKVVRAHRPSLAAVVVAAGSSTRFGEDKLFSSLAGRPLICTTLEAVCRAPGRPARSGLQARRPYEDWRSASFGQPCRVACTSFWRTEVQHDPKAS